MEIALRKKDIAHKCTALVLQARDEVKPTAFLLQLDRGARKAPRTKMGYLHCSSGGIVSASADERNPERPKQFPRFSDYKCSGRITPTPA